MTNSFAKNRRLLIRADASPEIGHGHALRMLALAQAWCDRSGSVSLATRECPDSVLERFDKEGVQIQQLSSQPLVEEAQSLRNLAAEGSFDWAVLDGYSFDTNYQTIIRAGNQRLMIVDDYLHHDCYSADVILNQNIGARADSYRDCALGAHVLAGLDYVLLRREFVGAMPRPRESDLKSNSFTSVDPKNILVTLGGADPQNLSSVLVEAISELVEPFGLQVRLLAGSSNPNWQSLQALAAKHPWLTVLTDVVEMVEQYAWAGLAIVGGGTTNWELCRFGVPRLVIVLAKNQAAIARGLELAGAAVNLGEGNSLSGSETTESIRGLLIDRQARESQARQALQMVDGRGAERVVNCLLQYLQ